MSALVPASVEVIHSGVLPTAEAWVYAPAGLARLAGPLPLLRPGAPRLPLSLVSFVIRHADGTVTLVDTGLHPRAITAPRRDFGRVGALVFGAVEPDGPAYDAQLRERGIDPAAVERVVMTHLHGDHTSAMRLLPGARFVCDAREWRAATARRAAFDGYVAGHLPPAGRMDLLDLGDDDHPLADGVALIPTPGHSAGHLSVLVQTAERPVLLAGDAVYTLRNLRERRRPYRVPDPERYEASVDRIAALGPEVLIVPSHDLEAWRSI